MDRTPNLDGTATDAADVATHAARDVFALLRNDQLEDWDFSLPKMKTQACAVTGGLSKAAWEQVAGTADIYRDICPRAAG